MMMTIVLVMMNKAMKLKEVWPKNLMLTLMMMKTVLMMITKDLVMTKKANAKGRR